MPLFPKTLRRRHGIIFLMLAGVLFCSGMALSSSSVTLIYGALCWMGCVVSTCLAMLMAVLDLRAIRKHWVKEHQNLVKSSFTDVERPGRSGTQS